MTIEEKLKELILQRYRSIREFTQVISMPYGTMDSILKRGVDNASISNILKICQELGISADELANGRIVPYSTVSQNRENLSDINAIINRVKTALADTSNVTLDGEPLAPEDVKTLLDTLDITVEVIRRKQHQA